MFSRATKLIVRSLGPRQFHIGEQNFKNVFSGAGGISQTLSQLLKSSMKLNVLALYDVTAVNKPWSNHNRIRNYCVDQTLIPSTVNTNEKKSHSTREEKSPDITVNDAVKIGDNSVLNFSNHQADNKKHETEELIAALYNLPVAEGVPKSISSLTPNETTSKLRPKEESPSGGFRESGTIGEQAVGGTGLRLGEPDCSDDPPARPKKNPCDPPKGPCRPSHPPGYPPSSKPRPKGKPFCVKCPPKKPCNDDPC
ncbi:uncharacterized protein LOC112588523 isoform X2 [Harpegnathos saltator]|uniref:uncharacterized protein LOC112588523 isoform X2 n=1 Tax=Harpegnathos saltator TaxID=610380 RepID=UPI000DBED134|nr:uncharacterized protein LOC112588523 isoform X2 [Harpegnathos saltator]